MPKHHIRFVDSLQFRMPEGMRRGAWRDRLLHDIYSVDRHLKVEILPSRTGESRVALHGTRFVLQALRDSERHDGIVVDRLGLQSGNGVPTACRRYACELVVERRESRRFDSVTALFSGRAVEVPASTSEQSELRADMLSPAVKQVLGRATAQIRELLRPADSVQEDQVEARLDFARRLWAQHGGLLGPFESSLLQLLSRETKEREPASSADLKAISQRFDEGFLNKLMAQKDDRAVLAAVWAIGHLPLRAELKAALWVATLRPLTHKAFMSELRAALPGLNVRAHDPDSDQIWAGVLATALRRRHEASHDPWSGELAELLEAGGPGLRLFIQKLQPPASAPASAVSSSIPTEVPLQRSAVPQEPSTPEHSEHPVEAAPGEPSTEAWLLRAALPGVDQLAGDVEVLSQMMSRCCPPYADETAAASALASLGQLASLAAQTVARYPSAEDIRRAGQQAKRALDAMRAHTTDITRLLLSPNATVQALEEIAAILSQRDNLADVPSWVWSTHGISDETRPVELLDAERRTLVQELLEHARSLGGSAPLRWLREPDGEDILEHVREWAEGCREFLGGLSAEDRALALAGKLGEDPQGSLRERQAIDALVGGLEETSAADVRAHLLRVPPGQRNQHIAEFARAIEFYRREVGSISLATLANLERRVAIERQQQPAPQGGVTGTLPLSVEHNWVDASGRTALLVLQHPDRSVAWGYVDAPIVLETESPLERLVKLAVDVRGPHRSAWPGEWPDIEPAEALSIPIYAWKRDPDRNCHQFAVKLRIPIRVPSGDVPRLEATVRVEDANGSAPLSSEKVLRWEGITKQSQVVSMDWQGATNPAFVSQHPIGPQASAQALRDRLASGASVAVIAPRRFGKSTLVEFLKEELRGRALVVPDPLVCTEYLGPVGFDLAEFWRALSARLEQVLDVGLGRALAGNAAPDNTAFDSVRRAAHGRGAGAVVILIDEAQLLFSGPLGTQLGTYLKNALERHWSRPDVAGLAPVRMCFVGLPSLSTRAGADLMGLLSPTTRMEMREDELRPLIKGMSRYLQTTRAARVRLAEAAGNLYVLRVLLDRVCERLNREGRTWCNVDDVAVVDRALEDDLRGGREPDLARYIRDALNDSESVSEWQPCPSLPVAAALAVVAHEGASHAETVSKATARLNEWARLATSDDTRDVIPRYDDQHVRSHIEKLEDRGVLIRGQFASRLLRAWLMGIEQTGAFDTAFLKALVSGSQRRIRIPSSARVIGEGREARVLMEQERAYRVKRLAGIAEQQQFLESCVMLEVVRNGQIRRDAGSEYLVELEEMGLSADNVDEAVQVYRWVPGSDLSGKEKVLNEDTVVDLGVKLSRGLSLLHKYGILHRDIRPTNIIANFDDAGGDGVRPVLIDFGFARSATAELHTRLAGAYAAPEVTGVEPRWSREADVFSLATTLHALLQPTLHQGKTARYLRECAAVSPAVRPSAEKLMIGLSELAEERKIASKQRDFMRVLEAVVVADQQKPWFARVFRKHQSRFVAIGMGFAPEASERFRFLAMFIEQLTEAYPPQGIRLKSLLTSAADPVRFLCAFRVQEAHAGELASDHRSALKQFGSLSAPEQKSSFLLGVETVAKRTNLNALVSLVDRLT
jgi:hypothetical protein